MWSKGWLFLSCCCKISCIIGSRSATGNHSESKQEDVPRWSNPNAGELKCNVDAAVVTNQNIFGIGMCIRNDHGQFVIAKTVVLVLDGVPLSQEVEAWGLAEAIKWIGELDFDKVSI